MVSITVRDLPDQVYRALQVRAASRGHSIEAEARLILEYAVKADLRIKLGSLLAETGLAAGGVDLNIERDKRPARAACFE